MPPRIVVDTNLFFSATILKRGLPFTLIEAWRHEIERVLSRPKTLTTYGVTAAERDDILVTLDDDAILVTPLNELPLPVCDSKDEPILGAALAGEADFLVTGDVDLLVLDGDPRLGKLRIVTVRAFLDILAAREEGADSRV